MAEIKVTSGVLKEKAGRLRQLNSQFKSQVSQLVIHQLFRSDAEAAFRHAFGLALYLLQRLQNAPQKPFAQNPEGNQRHNAADTDDQNRLTVLLSENQKGIDKVGQGGCGQHDGNRQQGTKQALGKVQ